MARQSVLDKAIKSIDDEMDALSQALADQIAVLEKAKDRLLRQKAEQQATKAPVTS